MKTCSRCRTAKSFGEFYRNKSTKDGYSAYCKQCYKSEYANKIKGPKVIQAVPNTHKKCCTCWGVFEIEQFNKNVKSPDGYGYQCRSCRRDYYRRNREKYLTRYALQKESKIEYQKQWNRDNIDRKRSQRVLLKRKLVANVTGRYKGAMTKKGVYHKSSFREIVGCTIKYYAEYLKERFRDGMTEENYGSVWEIDHIRPICSFDLSDPDQVHECFHFTNTQPLLKQENWSKGTSIPE